MPKTLILMRHSIAADPAGTRDFDRPLTTDGRQLADDTARMLSNLGAVPDSIIASAAVRTRQTAEQTAAQFDSSPEIQTTQDLYMATASGWWDAIIRFVPVESQTLLVIGHNPAASELMADLAGRRLPVPPATATVWYLSTDQWHDVQVLDPSMVRLQHLIVNAQETLPD